VEQVWVDYTCPCLWSKIPNSPSSLSCCRYTQSCVILTLILF